MSRSASKFQEKFMAFKFRGKEIFKLLNTGMIDGHVKCIREFIANIFFYTKDGITIMIDAGYNYDRLQEKMEWIGIRPSEIQHILITHQDTDHVGAVERDSDGLFRDATLYIWNGIFSIGAIVIPMRFLQSAFVGAMEKNNIAPEYIQGMIHITSGFMPVVIIIAGLIGGLLGGYIGQKALKKHFVKAGLVSAK